VVGLLRARRRRGQEGVIEERISEPQCVQLSGNRKNGTLKNATVDRGRGQRFGRGELLENLTLQNATASRHHLMPGRPEMDSSSIASIYAHHVRSIIQGIEIHAVMSLQVQSSIAADQRGRAEGPVQHCLS
jgi:hypothetical protein